MYGRQSFSLPRLTPFVKQLLIVLFACYVAILILQGWQGIPITQYVALTPGAPMVWQFVTYPLVDSGNPLFFLLGLLFLWWVLAPFEIGFGRKRTMQLCLATTLAAALPAWAIGVAIPGSPPLFGSGPLWIGGLAAGVYLYKDQPVSLFGAATMTAQQFLMLIVGLSVLMFLFSKNHTHLVADLGAIAGGIGYVDYLRRPRDGKSSKPPRKRRKSSKFRVIEGGGEGDGPGGRWLN